MKFNYHTGEMTAAIFILRTKFTIQAASGSGVNAPLLDDFHRVQGACETSLKNLIMSALS